MLCIPSIPQAAMKGMLDPVFKEVVAVSIAPNLASLISLASDSNWDALVAISADKSVLNVSSAALRLTISEFISSSKSLTAASRKVVSVSKSVARVTSALEALLDSFSIKPNCDYILNWNDEKSVIKALYLLTFNVSSGNFSFWKDLKPYFSYNERSFCVSETPNER